MSDKPKLISAAFETFEDPRGFLTATEFRDLAPTVSLSNFHYQLVTYSEHALTFRGFHYQRQPFAQGKVVLIHSGRLVDIAFPINLTLKSEIQIFEAGPGDIIFIPSDHAHGFITEEKHTILQYLMDAPFSPNHYTGINGAHAVSSYSSDIVMSQKDKNLPQSSIVNELVSQVMCNLR